LHSRFFAKRRARQYLKISSVSLELQNEIRTLRARNGSYCVPGLLLSQRPPGRSVTAAGANSDLGIATRAAFE
jgi:hypothetical protein